MMLLPHIRIMNHHLSAALLFVGMKQREQVLATYKPGTRALWQNDQHVLENRIALQQSNQKNKRKKAETKDEISGILKQKQGFHQRSLEAIPAFSSPISS